jgi:molybdate transport system substrate-binding protein
VRSSVIAIVAITALVGACSNDDATGDVTADVGAVELTVSAASSLTAPFTEIAKGFEARYQGVRVTFNFGPSDGLANQIQEGAPVDVFASASPTWMDAVADEPGVTGRQDFARNRLAIIVPIDDPANISSLEDLAAPGVKLVLAAEGVPAGDYARQMFDAAGITDEAMANVVSNEEDVKAVIAKVLSGDADAGVAYVTDVTPDIADQVALVEIPDEQNVIATYPIAVVADSERPALAEAFVDFVLGQGEDVLHRYGFLPV